MKHTATYDIVRFEDITSRVMPDYADSDIMMISDFRELPVFNDKSMYMKMDFFLLVGCRQGMAKMEIDTNRIELHKDELLCYIPNSIIANILVSIDFDAVIICMTSQILQDILRKEKNLMNYYMNIKNNPVISIGRDGVRLLKFYQNFLEKRLMFMGHKYQKVVMTSLLSAGLYDLLGNIDLSSLITDCKAGMSRTDSLSKQFIEMLSADVVQTRSVKYYADRLCVTPKYLTVAVKKSSGRTVYDWITERMVTEITHYLKYSDLSIKEIANKLAFPNLSFFGRYVKKHLGVSPSEYRQKIAKWEMGECPKP